MSIRKSRKCVRMNLFRVELHAEVSGQCASGAGVRDHCDLVPKMYGGASGAVDAMMRHRPSDDQLFGTLCS